MASVDSLLRFVTQRDAEVLVIRSNAAPKIRSRSGSLSLSMPPMGRGMVELFLKELISEEEYTTLQTGCQIDTTHETPQEHRFSVRAGLEGSELSITFRLERPERAKAAPLHVVEPTPQASSPEPMAPSPTPSPLQPRVGAEVGGSTEAPRKAGGRLIKARDLFDAEPQKLPGETERLMENLLSNAAHNGASDLYLSSGRDACQRVGGRLTIQPDTAVTEDDLAGFFSPRMTMDQRAILEETGSVDLALTVGGRRGQRFRINLFRQADGLTAACRPIRDRIPSLSELRLPQSLTTLMSHPHGLVLVTGTTGSGKSTTLAALIQWLNESVPRHVVTIEDPIEFRYPQGKCLIHQREVGRHVSSFSGALHAALREAPDVILVGEMRDRDTVAAALTAAETGHLVLATLHTGSAAMAVDRIIDVFETHRQAQVRLQLADVLRAVISQRLLPEQGTGRRIPALEILTSTHAVTNLIREAKTSLIASYLETGKEAGMIPLDRSLARLVQDNRISLQTAFDATTDKSHLAHVMGVPVPI